MVSVGNCRQIVAWSTFENLQTQIYIAFGRSFLTEIGPSNPDSRKRVFFSIVMGASTIDSSWIIWEITGRITIWDSRSLVQFISRLKIQYHSSKPHPFYDYNSIQKYHSTARSSAMSIYLFLIKDKVYFGLFLSYNDLLEKIENSIPYNSIEVSILMFFSIPKKYFSYYVISISSS